MRRVSCRRCNGQGWVALPGNPPADWWPTEPWPAGVHGWNKADCPACGGGGEVLTDVRTDAPAVQHAAGAENNARPAVVKIGRLFNAP